MAIRFKDGQGRTGTLDVAKYVAGELGGEITGVKDGMVLFKTEDGKNGSFGLGQWAESHQAQIVTMDGFNSAETALEMAPNGMNYMDQTVFFHDGMDMDALGEIFPKNMKRGDGRIVVLDNDGLWKTMWSPYLHAPLGPMDESEMVERGMMQDPEMVIRSAGIIFMLGLAGINASSDYESNYKVEEIVGALEIIGRNAPFEIKSQIGEIIEQTTGLTKIKFMNAMLAPREVGAALMEAKGKQMNSFEYRMMQCDMAVVIMEAQQLEMRATFMDTVGPLIKETETDRLLINLKGICDEFIQTMVSLDLLRDISKSTGLNEWIAMNEEQAVDPARLPDMPEFIPKFIAMLKWIMPVIQKPALAMARGKTGFKALINLSVMLDDCMFALAGVPDHSAKYKMIMALRRLQSAIETKLTFVYHPDPMQNKNGLKENPFMQAKQQFGPVRDALYKTLQTPKETWAQVLLGELSQQVNVERYYDSLNPKLAKLWKSFAALDAAYDMQPWVDVNHKARTHDAFSDFHPSFGERPPEAGYLSKNSTRAVQNISETLIVASGILQSMDQKQARELLRNPYQFSLLMKSVMVSSVNREIGTVEVLNKFGIGPDSDPHKIPDPNRIWEDPEKVQVDIDRQVEELMGSLAMEQMSQPGGGTPKGPDGMDAPLTQEEGVPKAGPGPQGPPRQAMAMRR